jgi:transcription termination/antitermination protein NusG
VVRPLFPGYIFARFADSGFARHTIMRTAGAVRIVASGSGLAAVSEQELEAVRRMLSSGGTCAPHPFLREGAVVRVRRGPLKDLEGILVKVKSQARLVLSVTLLSRSVATEVCLSDVELVRMSDGPGSLVA